MSLYVLRYGSERGKGAYVAATDLGGLFQRSATRWPSRRMARFAADLRTTHEPVRIVRLRPKRTLIGYVVRLDGPGEEKRWAASTGGALYTHCARARLLLGTQSEATRAVQRCQRHGRYPHARVVPVYLRVRP